MSPVPDSPLSNKSPVNSKQIDDIVNQLREDIYNNRWDCITVDNLCITFPDSGLSELSVIFKDANNHMHSFLLHLHTDNERSCEHEEMFALTYRFDGNFESDHKIRSFIDYLDYYLSYEGLEMSSHLHPYIESDSENKYIIKYSEYLNTSCNIAYAYRAFCTLIDVTLSHLKPLVWFYTSEPCIKSFEEMRYYLAGVMARLQLECCADRWDFDPLCFHLGIYKEAKEVCLMTNYTVEDVWELSLCLNVAQCDEYFDLFFSFNCYTDDNLSDCASRKLNVLFGEFLSTLNSAKGNICRSFGDTKKCSINITFFHIEDTFDLFCKLLDEIVPALKIYDFKIPLQHLNPTGKIETIKTQLESSLFTSFEVLTEEDQINRKLQCGHFV